MIDSIIIDDPETPEPVKVDMSRMLLVVGENGAGKTRLLESLRDPRDSHTRTGWKVTVVGDYPRVVVPHYTPVSMLWDRLDDGSREISLAALRLIEPRVVAIVCDHGVQVTLDDHRVVSLTRLGAGAAKALRVVTAVAAARDGLALVDGFDVHLHWSVLRLLWRLIAVAATSVDAQVVATTHGLECVRAFRDALVGGAVDGSLVHLGRSVMTSERGALVATAYDARLLDIAVDYGLEVR